MLDPARIALLAACVMAISTGCHRASVPLDTSDGGDVDTDSDSDNDSDGDTDSDTDGDSDSDADADTDTGTVIQMDCSECPAVGGTLDKLVCAIDLCDEDAVIDIEYSIAPDIDPDWALTDTYEAVERFGDPTNDLAPLLNGSYALLATGPAEGTSHSASVTLEQPIIDPFCEGSDCDEDTIRDAVELRLLLSSPVDAEAFRVSYVFFSEEFDDYVDSVDDSFYIVLEAGSTNGGEPTIINYGPCRDPVQYFDFTCGPDDLGCEEGEYYCYLTVDTGFAECCWYEGCPDGIAETDITGTGFECAENEMTDSSDFGSSTGWLRTSWPIVGGETFALTFHLHDHKDAIYDAEVIIDAFQFLTEEAIGTVVLE